MAENIEFYTLVKDGNAIYLVKNTFPDFAFVNFGGYFDIVDSDNTTDLANYNTFKTTNSDKQYWDWSELLSISFTKTVSSNGNFSTTPAKLKISIIDDNVEFIIVEGDRLTFTFLDSDDAKNITTNFLVDLEEDETRIFVTLKHKQLATLITYSILVGLDLNLIESVESSYLNSNTNIFNNTYMENFSDVIYNGLTSELLDNETSVNRNDIISIQNKAYVESSYAPIYINQDDEGVLNATSVENNNLNPIFSFTSLNSVSFV